MGLSKIHIGYIEFGDSLHLSTFRNSTGSLQCGAARTSGAVGVGASQGRE